MNAELEEMRSKIDKLDEQLLNILARRMKEVELVGKFKKSKDIPPLDQSRWVAAMEERQKIAGELGLQSHYVSKLFDVIHEYALELESKTK